MHPPQEFSFGGFDIGGISFGSTFGGDFPGAGGGPGGGLGGILSPARIGALGGLESLGGVEGSGGLSPIELEIQAEIEQERREEQDVLADTLCVGEQCATVDPNTGNVAIIDEQGNTSFIPNADLALQILLQQQIDAERRREQEILTQTTVDPTGTVVPVPPEVTEDPRRTPPTFPETPQTGLPDIPCELRLGLLLNFILGGGRDRLLTQRIFQLFPVLQRVPFLTPGATRTVPIFLGAAEATANPTGDPGVGVFDSRCAFVEECRCCCPPVSCCGGGCGCGGCV